MDTGEGKFEFFQSEEELEKLKEQYPNHGQIFKEGDIVGVFKKVEDGKIEQVNFEDAIGSMFVIEGITPTGLILNLLPK
jgi:hypothetical protein